MTLSVIPALAILFLVGIGFVFAPQVGRLMAWFDRQSLRTVGLLLIAQAIVLGLLFWWIA